MAKKPTTKKPTKPVKANRCLVLKNFCYEDNGNPVIIRKMVDGVQNDLSLSDEAIKVGVKCKAIKEIK